MHHYSWGRTQQSAY